MKRAKKAAGRRVVVIGGGVGGLTTAALLARRGLDVTVLEAHVYVGGCAGTFYHKKYRFEAGATLAGGFYRGGPMDLVASAAGISAWPARPASHAMRVHLPDGARFDRITGTGRWEARADAFGHDAEPFWRWQEATADALWALALRNPAWPPRRLGEALSLGRDAAAWLWSTPPASLPGLLRDALRPVAAHLTGSSERLRLAVDGQLLIAAQATGERANALYGAAALDLPRRGVVHMEGGIGAIAETLAEAIIAHGGRVLRRREAVRIEVAGDRPRAVITRRGERYPADVVVANLPPWNILRLLGEDAPPRLRRLPERPEPGWGAFTLYVGLPQDAVAADVVLHHQVLRGRPLGEGNSLFLSLSPDWDGTRAPAGHRALTISTHTDLGPWWRLFEQDRDAYENRKEAMAKRMLEGAERALPGIQAAAALTLPGTPVTFQRFTRRQWGWVGGFPQTNLFTAWGPRLSPDLWMVGDSIFPGQSTAAVALGGMRVGRAILAGMAGRRDTTIPSFSPSEVAS